MYGRFAAATIAALLFLPAAAGADVGDFVGKPISTVTVIAGGRPTTDPRLVGLVETEAGQPLRVAAVRESIAHLFSLGEYEDVRVSALAAGTSVALTYELVPLRTIQDVSFTGNSAAGIDSNRLKRLIALRFGASPPPGRAAEIEALVGSDLKEVGYLHARVNSRLEAQRGGPRSMLAVSIVPGDRTRVGSVDVEGDAGMSVAQFLDALRLSRGLPFEREVLNSRIDRYLDERRSHGYFAARVSYSPQFVEDDRTANLTVTIVPGPHVTLLFVGDSIPNDRRADLVPIAREGSADEDVLEDATNRIEEQLRSEGYRDATAPHSTDERNGELYITFNVRKGPQYRVGRIDISGNASISLPDLQQHLRIRPGQPYSAAALEVERTLIEDVYHREGFAAAQASIRNESEPALAAAVDVPVAIRIAITENARTIVERVRIEGTTAVAEADLRNGLTLQGGRPFWANALAADRDALQLRLANLGFQSATVIASPGISADGRSADVLFSVREGQRISVDHVLIAGNQRTRTATIERELQFKAGEPLGLEQVNESQRRLAALGLFRRVRITELAHGDEAKRDVLVSVEEAPVTTIGFGSGVEAGQRLRTDKATGVASEKIEVAPRASFEIGRRNLFGTKRSVNLFTSASVHPEAASSAATPIPSTSGGPGFLEYRVLGQFREPRVFTSNTDFRVIGTLEQQRRSSFDFSRRSINAELARRLSPEVSISGGYQIQYTHTFHITSDQRLIDRIFPKKRLSSFSTSVIRDTRDDPFGPLHGQYLSANGQIAARAVGSEVGFVKSFFTAQTFRTVPRTTRVVVAGSARLGLATGFGSEVLKDLPDSERFYAGGDTTVRGFAIDELGVRHVPSQDAVDTLDPEGFPLGGNGLMIFNGELRVPVYRDFGVVGFVDAGNVFKRAADISPAALRPALGFGVRYKSPVGPIRFDLGFKLDRRSYESPKAWFITFGQAF